MQLVNEFVVPRGVDETWAVLTDVERIAPAMPGAELTGVEDGKYHGKVKIKVGPVTAAYAGVASFRMQDPVSHHMVLDATGKESTGRGRAAAVVTADLAPDGPDTRVTVTTDLTISGPLAQFGRGAIAEVSTRLLNQFVDNLKQTVLTDSPNTTAAAPTAAPGPPGDAPPGDTGTHRPPTRPAPADRTPTGSMPANPMPAGPTPAGPAPESTATTTGSMPATSFETPPSMTGRVNGVPAGAAMPPPVRPPSPVTPAPVPEAPARPTEAPAAEVNLLKVAAWPILKRAIPLIIVIAAIIVLIVWLV
jgi:carbon monoxide dehydrogenase subunit G